MPVASIDHLNSIVAGFRGHPHRKEFSQPGHLNDRCEDCVAILHEVGASAEEVAHIFNETPAHIREQVRAAIMEGVDAKVAVVFFSELTRDDKPPFTIEDVLWGPLRIPTKAITFNVPVRDRVTA